MQVDIATEGTYLNVITKELELIAIPCPNAFRIRDTIKTKLK